MDSSRGVLKRILLLIAFVMAFHGGCLAAQDREPERADALPRERLKVSDALFREGYLQALIDMHYYEYAVTVRLKEGVAYVDNLPANASLRASIISFICDFPGVEKVEEIAEMAAAPVDNGSLMRPVAVMGMTEPVMQKRVGGIWFPQSTLLFPVLAADPLRVAYSGSYFWGDRLFGQRFALVSLGDHFPIYRWRDVRVWRYRGDLQWGLEGCAWAHFNMSDRADLQNTDIYVGLPFTYAFDQWAFRLRLYHISSHLGDEFMIKHPAVERKNPSKEALDFFALYDLTKALRVYAGVGYVLRTDKGYKVKSSYAEGGAEVRLFGSKDVLRKLYLQPFLAMHFRFWADHRVKIPRNLLEGTEETTETTGTLRPTYLTSPSSSL